MFDTGKSGRMNRQKCERMQSICQFVHFDFANDLERHRQGSSGREVSLKSERIPILKAKIEQIDAHRANWV